MNPFLLAVGALLGGLFLALKDFIPYLTARSSGVIKRKGHAGRKVSRTEDPEQFNRLLANRARSASVGLLVAFAGAVVLSLYAMALFSTYKGPLAIFLTLVFVGVGIFAIYCLIRGFATGRMFGFWSLSLYGEATLKQNPTWFWIYTLINVLIVISLAFGVLGMSH